VKGGDKMLGFSKKSTKTEVGIENLASKLDQLVEILSQEPDLNQTSTLSNNYDERLEGLERRFERLHEDCLKYLQRGSAAQKRAEILRGDIDFDEEEDTESEPVQMPVEMPEETTEEDDLNWAAEQLRSRGQTPIFG
jgi:hypothetical protein